MLPISLSSRTVSRRGTQNTRAVRGPQRKTSPSKLRSLKSLQLTYGDVFTISDAHGFALRTFRLNSIFDPDRTGVGGQPTYYTQLAALYDTYRVRAVDLDFEFFNTSAADAPLVGLIANPVNSGPTASGVAAQQLLLEGKHSRYAWLSGGLTTNPKSRARLHFSINLAELCGEKVDDDDFSAAFSQNPFSECDLDVVILDPSNADIAVAATYIARITYHVDVMGLLSTYQD
jgi:hypothetical protein